mmetsp:Transcript_23402/g.48622  ORF Transcript_23402/g.48622 Transcript_23402/m.48622 type:complete len:111 (+) Transcript_23402:876-1208(+)
MPLSVFLGSTVLPTSELITGGVRGGEMLVDPVDDDDDDETTSALDRGVGFDEDVVDDDEAPTTELGRGEVSTRAASFRLAEEEEGAFAEEEEDIVGTPPITIGDLITPQN